jgi:major pilin subunit PapA
MNLKLSKIMLTTLLLSGTTLLHAAGGQGQGSGQVQFHGYIVNAPCSIVSDNPIKVEFGQISNKLLNNGTAYNGESHIEPFAIELADCDITDLTDGTVATTFTYTSAAVEGVGENYVGLDSLPDSGAGIVIVAGNEQVVNGTALKPKKIQNGPNTLEFTSFVKGLGQGPVKTGEFYANANFTLAYQ